MCATRQNENDMIRNLHSYWSINNFLHHKINKEFEIDMRIYLNSIITYTHTKISSPLFPIGPIKFVWQIDILFAVHEYRL